MRITPVERAVAPKARSPREWTQLFTILRKTVATLPQQKAAMFMLADEGFASVFEQVVAAIISVRTIEQVTLPASRRLFKRARTPAAVAALGVAEIEKLIAPTTFAGAKARDIHAIAIKVRDEYGGRLPCDVEMLDAFRGVGPKVANLAIAASTDCDGPAGIPVDIHVHRVTNRWGDIATSTPEKTQAALEAILPRRYWAEINELLVPFGKYVCTGVAPRCSTCPLNSRCAKANVTTHR
jgi:endonuclease III